MLRTWDLTVNAFFYSLEDSDNNYFGTFFLWLLYFQTEKNETTKIPYQNYVNWIKRNGIENDVTWYKMYTFKIKNNISRKKRIFTIISLHGLLFCNIQFQRQTCVSGFQFIVLLLQRPLSSICRIQRLQSSLKMTRQNKHSMTWNVNVNDESKHTLALWTCST